MNRKCHLCGNQRLTVAFDQLLRIGIPWLTNFLQRRTEYACNSCGAKIDEPLGTSLVDSNRPTIPVPSAAPAAGIQRTSGSIFKFGGSPARPMHLQFPAVIDTANLVSYPTSEGNVQDATSVDQFGEPDLMTEFAEEYLRQFWILLPAGRLPASLKELMPALLLLYAATELALKAFWVRSEKEFEPNHSLIGLFEELDPSHKKEITGRFKRLGNNPALTTLGVDSPEIEYILAIYSATYGGASNVHMDARYYAEPTIRFRNNTGLRGAHLVKSGTPYPVFLPYLVQALIDAYHFFSGSERLRRLGADIRNISRDSTKGNHGKWRLMASSLDLVVVRVSQHAGEGAQFEDLEIFENFKATYPTGFIADWMYGGDTLLFYRAGGQMFPDGDAVIDGLDCEIRSNERIGLHTRDAYRLADILELADNSVGSLGHLPATGVAGTLAN